MQRSVHGHWGLLLLEESNLDRIDTENKIPLKSKQRDLREKVAHLFPCMNPERTPPDTSERERC